MSAPDGLEPQAWLEVLSEEECEALLRAGSVGRIAFMGLYGFPVILPVNYRALDSPGAPWLALRTRPGNVIDRARLQVAFEIDGIDTVSRQGWSVLVRGKLHRTPAQVTGGRPETHSEPWLAAERDSCLLIEPALVSGRRLRTAPAEWGFHPRAYL